jgi:hypothetical protein
MLYDTYPFGKQGNIFIYLYMYLFLFCIYFIAFVVTETTWHHMVECLVNN